MLSLNYMDFPIFITYPVALAGKHKRMIYKPYCILFTAQHNLVHQGLKPMFTYEDYDLRCF